MSPPSSSKEPRYNSFDMPPHHSPRNQSYYHVDQNRSPMPSTSTAGPSTRIGSNGVSARCRFEGQIDRSKTLEETVPHLDPPKGFESIPEPSTATTSLPQNNSNNLSAQQRLSNSSSSSNLSVTTEEPSRQSIQQQSTSNGDSSQEHDTQTGSNEMATSSTSGTVNQPSSSSGSSPDQYAVDNNGKPIPSTSNSSRLFSGFNNIVSKISRAFAASASISMISTDRCFQDDMPKFAFAHKRSLEKTWKLMDKVVKCCQQPRMNLNNSPPFILEILPETYQYLKLIHTKYESSKDYPHNDNDYSIVFLRNLQNRCKQTLKLFKDAKEGMFDETSEYRHKLTRHTLVFNHIISELRAIFPNGQFIGDRYLITKKETAGEFWKESFGTSILVDWKSFYHALQRVHKIDSTFFSLHALKQTIDLTCDDYISIFEFDVFTRLFQPWATLLRNWQILAVTHPGYKAFLTYDELKARLQKHIDKPGSYVFRLSCTRLGQWAIGYVTPERQILQTIVQNISLSQALTETKFYIYPDGKDEDPNLSLLCSGMAGDERNVTVTEEQYEIYCGVGNSFQSCKICFENDKDIRVEPCNHLLCTSCLLAWQESEGQGCPFCRTEIKETVQITMDLPKSDERPPPEVSDQ